MTQRERFEVAKAALKEFDAKNGNKYLYSDTKAARAWNNRRAELQNAVAEAYWTDEMEGVIAKYPTFALIAATSGCPECGKSDSHEEGCQIGITEQFEHEQREIKIRESRVRQLPK